MEKKLRRKAFIMTRCKENYGCNYCFDTEFQDKLLGKRVCPLIETFFGNFGRNLNSNSMPLSFRKKRSKVVVSFIVSEFYPRGGVGIAVFEFAKALFNRGYEVHVFTPQRTANIPRYKEQEIIEGIIVHKIGKTNTNKYNPIPYLINRLTLFFALRKLNPSVIISEFLNFTAAEGTLYANILGIKNLARTHGADVDEVHTFGSLLKLANWFSLKYSDVLLTTNREFKEKMSRRVQNKDIWLLPNVHREVHIPFTRAQCRKKLNLNESFFHLLAIGRLVRVREIETKGISYAIRAMKYLDNCCLHIIGDGPLISEYMQIIEKEDIKSKVIMHGRVPWEDVQPFMKGADALIFPSITEGLSMTMIEAMSMKLPVIVTRVGGAAEYIIEGENGLFVERKNSKSIEDAVRKISNNPELQKRLGENAYKTYKNNFTEEKVVSRFEEILHLNGIYII